MTIWQISRTSETASRESRIPPPRQARPEIRDSREGRERQNVTHPAFPPTFCRRTPHAWRTRRDDASARSPESRHRASPVLNARPLQPDEKKPSEARIFLPFRPAGNFFAARDFRLCGKRRISFSKEISFCAHKNAGSGTEMLPTDISAAYILTIARFPGTAPSGPASRKPAKNFLFARNTRKTPTLCKTGQAAPPACPHRKPGHLPHSAEIPKINPDIICPLIRNSIYLHSPKRRAMASVLALSRFRKSPISHNNNGYTATLCELRGIYKNAFFPMRGMNAIYQIDVGLYVLFVVEYGDTSER